MVKNRKQNRENSLYERLIANYTPELPLISRNGLSVKEKSSIYKLELSGSVPTVVFCVDGEIISTGLRCDKLVLIEMDAISSLWSVVFVELKGTDVLHAIKQLRETIKNGLFRHSSNKKLYARVVGSSYPSNKSNPAIEKAKIEFRMCYHCDLKTLKSAQPDRLKLDY